MGLEPTTTGLGEPRISREASQSGLDSHQLASNIQLTVDNQLLQLFSSWLQRKGISEEMRERYVRYVARFEHISPENILKSRLSRNAIKALRNYLHFLYEMGLISEETHDRLCKLLKIPKSRELPEIKLIDLNEIKRSLSIIANAPKDIKLAYLICYFSGCRLRDACRVLQHFDNKRVFDLGHHIRYGLLRGSGSKYALWIYLPKTVSLERIAVDPRRVSDYCRRHKLVPPKMLRKFWYQIAMDIIKDRELVDFFQGRISNLSIGSRHYDALLSRADKEYPKVLNALFKVMFN